MALMKTASAILGVVGLVFISTVARAQIIAQTRDATCTDWTQQECGGPTGQGCNSTSFAVGAAGYYQVAVSLEGCGLAHCDHCLAVTYLYNGLGQLVLCLHGGCGCDSDYQSIWLDDNQTYTLYSCKIDCGDAGCYDCSTSCVAHATVASMP